MSTTGTVEAVRKVAALNRRIEDASKILMAGSEKDQALALLLSHVGASIEYSVRVGRPVGLLPLRVRVLLDLIEAEWTEAADHTEED